MEQPNDTYIETERLILRPWIEEDAEILYRYASNPDIGSAAGWPVHTSVEESLEVIRTVFSAPEIYAVVLKATGEPVGSCGLMSAERIHEAGADFRDAEIGYWIGKPYWGQGLIPEATRVLLARAFGALGLHAVWCCFYDGNVKSGRVCEKCGFKYHHTALPSPGPTADIRTEHFYRMTAEDFTLLSQSPFPTSPTAISSPL